MTEREINIEIRCRLRFLISSFAVLGFSTYKFCGSFMSAQGDCCDPTGSSSFILPLFSARMYKSSSSQTGIFVFMQFHTHHWHLSQYSVTV